MSEVVTGTFEPNGKSGGALRSSDAGYRVNRTDVAVSPELCRTLKLRGGEQLTGTAKAGGGRQRSGARQLSEVHEINGMPVDDFLEAASFDELTAIHPDRQVHFETKEGSSSMRVIDLMTPIGFGQRGLIVAPPRTGKTVLLQQMAKGVAENHPDVKVFVLLVDERPEEVTDMKRNVPGEVVASSNDKDIDSHIRVARLTIDRAKRLVEAGQDVLVFLDSLTRLGRAFNANIRGGGRIMSGGLDTRALTEPKSIFGAARNCEEGGSLTIVASALIDTGSRMDEVIFNEFKGTGNMEIMLCRDMANRRVWPAIDLNLSGTRQEERLLTPAAYEVSKQIRRTLIGKSPERAMDILLGIMDKHKDNDAFVAGFSNAVLR